MMPCRLSRHALVALTILITGCSGSSSTDPSMAVENLFPPLVSVEVLLLAPEEVSINSQNFTLGTSLWRNFMPGSSSELTASITISETNFNEIPASIDATYLWIVNREEIWATPFSDEARPPSLPYQIDKIARDGPKWDPGIDVHVIVKLVDQSGKEYLLKAANQVIGAPS